MKCTRDPEHQIAPCRGQTPGPWQGERAAMQPLRLLPGTRRAGEEGGPPLVRRSTAGFLCPGTPKWSLQIPSVLCGASQPAAAATLGGSY